MTQRPLLLGLAVGTGRRQARGRVDSGPNRRARQGGFRVNKSGSQVLTTWYPPILRVLNPFPAMVCRNSNLSEGFRAENLKL